MTHNEKWLLGHAAWTALVGLAVWLTCRIGRKAAVEDAEDRGYGEALADFERNAITATVVEESAGYDPPPLPAQTQVTALDFNVYRATHTTYAELAPEVLDRQLSAGEQDPDAPWCPGCGFANYSASPCEVCGYDDQNPAGPGHLDRHPDEWGDDTALDAFRQWGSWEEQLAAIDATLGDSPWFTARRREMAA